MSDWSDSWVFNDCTSSSVRQSSSILKSLISLISTLWLG
jgi:hypothetical protein